MFANYLDYWNTRWQELDVKARSQGLAMDSQAIKDVQVGALIQVATELQNSGHHDVGLFLKNSGNNYDMNGTLIACDIFAIKDTDALGNIASTQFVTVDAIVSGMSPNAVPAWQIQGISNGTWVLPSGSKPPVPNPVPPADKLDQIIWLCSITYQQTVENHKLLVEINGKLASRNGATRQPAR